MMHEFYRSQKHPMLPTKLKGKLEKQGYKNIKTLEIPFFITNKDENSFPKYHEILMVNAAIKKVLQKTLYKNGRINLKNQKKR